MKTPVVVRRVHSASAAKPWCFQCASKSHWGEDCPRVRDVARSRQRRASVFVSLETLLEQRYSGTLLNAWTEEERQQRLRNLGSRNSSSGRQEYSGSWGRGEAANYAGSSASAGGWGHVYAAGYSGARAGPYVSGYTASNTQYGDTRRQHQMDMTRQRYARAEEQEQSRAPRQQQQYQQRQQGGRNDQSRRSSGGWSDAAETKSRKGNDPSASATTPRQPEHKRKRQSSPPPLPSSTQSLREMKRSAPAPSGNSSATKPAPPKMRRTNEVTSTPLASSSPSYQPVYRGSYNGGSK